MKKIMTLKVWILVIFLIMSILAIRPNPMASGVVIESVGSSDFSDLEAGMILKSVNDVPINTLEDYSEAIKDFESELFEVNIQTSNEYYSYNATRLGFDVDENLTVISTTADSPVLFGSSVISINGVSVSDKEEFYSEVNNLFVKEKVVVETDKGLFAFLTSQSIKEFVIVAEETKTNLKLGIDLKGGARILLDPYKDDGSEVTDDEISDLIDVLDSRMNAYGLKDIKIKKANDWEGNKFVVVEISGASKDSIDAISEQGVFEAKIGDEVVFEGGERDVTYVCRKDGSCSGIRDCFEISNGEYCKFEFVIHLSPAAAERHAEVTKSLSVVKSESGKDILSEMLDFYIDGNKVDSLQIGADLKGAEATNIVISGPGYGSDRDSAIENALANMENLQTILITGSLPVKVEVAKVDNISPVIGKEFVSNAILAAVSAMLAVGLVVFIRYRKIKVVIPMLFTMLSEVIIILGFAALMRWNLDLAAIAGIIAAVGTGVDDQIVITDEVLRGGSKFLGWKEKIKRAFFIIMTSFFTTFVAMAPLIQAGAGLIRGFALTTLVGITIGVFLTRPAFASIIEKLLD